MGEKKLTDEIVDEMLARAKPAEIRWIDPMKLAVWNMDLAIEMVSGTVSKSTIKRAIENHELKSYKPGKEISFVPADFLTWYKRHTL